MNTFGSTGRCRRGTSYWWHDRRRRGCAAHTKGILHRDVKPANMLVRREENGWRVKIIDFGLALVKKAAPGSASTSRHGKTLMGASVAGTLHYAAPEQLGQMPGVAIGPHSDVYGFGKTCAYALFKTTQTCSRHFAGLPAPLTELLEACMEEQPEMRPADFAKVLERLMLAENELFPELAVVQHYPEAEVVKPAPAAALAPLEDVIDHVAALVNPAPAAASAPLPTAKVLWYYMHKGQRRGPVSEDHLKARIAAGQVAHSDLVWQNGMADWVAVMKMPQLLPPVRRAVVPPPIPPRPCAKRPAPPPVPRQAAPTMRDMPVVECLDMAYVHCFMPAQAKIKDLFSFTYTFKVYLDGDLKIEAPHKVGFNLRLGGGARRPRAGDRDVVRR